MKGLLHECQEEFSGNGAIGPSERENGFGRERQIMRVAGELEKELGASLLVHAAQSPYHRELRRAPHGPLKNLNQDAWRIRGIGNDEHLDDALTVPIVLGGLETLQNLGNFFFRAALSSL